MTRWILLSAAFKRMRSSFADLSVFYLTLFLSFFFYFKFVKRLRNLYTVKYGTNMYTWFTNDAFFLWTDILNRNSLSIPFTPKIYTGNLRYRILQNQLTTKNEKTFLEILIFFKITGLSWIGIASSLLYKASKQMISLQYALLLDLNPIITSNKHPSNRRNSF